MHFTFSSLSLLVLWCSLQAKAQIRFNEGSNEQLDFSDGSQQSAQSQAIPQNHETNYYNDRVFQGQFASSTELPEDFVPSSEEDEIVNDYFHGHEAEDPNPKQPDPEKEKRQAGCVCVAKFRDPHCGSDNREYDNGCFFDCAMKRNPELGLKNWGRCTSRILPT